jgi:hypothetical protein
MVGVHVNKDDLKQDGTHCVWTEFNTQAQNPQQFDKAKLALTMLVFEQCEVSNGRNSKFIRFKV